MRFPWRAAGGVLAGLAVAVSVVVRFAVTGPLWLDEALSVNIAALPLGELVEALRHDGSPPLYYLLLKWWMDAFGDSVLAVRGLSAVVGLLTIAAAWAFAREATGSTRVAHVAALLVTTSPFAMRYAAEARMYALVMLLVALGGWALVRLVRTGSRRAGLGAAACSGLLLLTHYWAIYLLAVVLLALLVRRERAAFAWTAAGGVLFLPWLPSFVFQLANTGTPWASRPMLGSIFEAVSEWSGTGPVSRLLFVLLLLLGALGVFGTGVDGRRVELDLRGRPVGRRLAGVTFGTLLLGVVVGLALRSGYAARYSAVAVVPFLVLAALGAETLLDRRVLTGVVVAALVLGTVTGTPFALKHRTQARVVADELEENGLGDGDVVVYCPDQLGPAVDRELSGGMYDQIVYPTGERPGLVDWVDYAARNEAADPVAFADDLLRRYDRATIWLVVAGGYKTFEDDCEELAERLRAARAETPLVRSRGRYTERMSLVKLAP